MHKRMPDRYGLNSGIGSFFFAVLLLSVFYAEGQISVGEKEIGILPVPSIGYSPETNTYIGAVSLFAIRTKHDSLTRTSNAKLEFNYTWNKQVILETDWNLFSKGEKWFSKGLIHYSKYPDLFYGIGFNTPACNEVSFESNRLMLDLNLFRGVRGKFIGGGVNFSSFSDIKSETQVEAFGEPAFRKISIKAIYLADRRNSILSPAKGHFLEINNSLSYGLALYFKTILDYRKYFEWGNEKQHVLSTRVYYESLFGEAPFFELPMVGGDEYLRGYYLGRFRDKNLFITQLECRIRVFGRIGLAAFGGAGTLYKSLGNLRSENIKPNAGIGFRFLADKKEMTNLRFDYAVGLDGQSGFYISFGESF